MSKIIIAVMLVLQIAYAVNGLCSDTCSGRNTGGRYASRCQGPASRYFECRGRRVVYMYCGDNTQCLIKGACGQCQDSCRGKRNGDYQSLDNPRPFYYHCENGFLSYRTCHPNEVFNAWTCKCECYEVFCEKGNGYQPSVCGNGGCSGYVKCEGGFPVLRRQCRGRRPYFCCKRQVCTRDSSVCGQCDK